MGQHSSSHKKGAPNPALQINRFYSHFGIFETHKTLRLSYPSFPDEFNNLLPEIPLDQITDSICVCPTCAPALWSLPPTLVHPLNGAGSTINRCCDYRRILSHTHDYLASLGSNSSASQASMIEQIKRALDNLTIRDKVTVTQQEVSSLATLLDKLFFNGCLDGVTYDVRTPDQDPGLVKTSKQNVVGYSTFPPRNPKGLIVVEAKLHKGPKNGLLGTLLHEMLHNFLARHLCSGRSGVLHTRYDERSRLCQYMYARFVNLFDHTILPKSNQRGAGSEVGEITNHTKAAIYTSTRFTGHGPIFQMVLEWIHEAVPKILGKKYPVAKVGNPCERKHMGKVSPDKCWSHHCDGYRDMQKMMLRCASRKKTDARSDIGGD